MPDQSLVLPLAAHVVVATLDGLGHRPKYTYASLAVPVAGPKGCPLCRQPVVEPFQTPCQHVFCYQCLLQALYMTSACPLCNTPLTIRDCRPAAPTHRHMPPAPAPAPAPALQAGWQGSQRDLRRHTEAKVCRFAASGCKWTGLDEEAHVWSEHCCVFRDEGCRWLGPAQEMAEHMAATHACPYARMGCQVVAPEARIREHARVCSYAPHLDSLMSLLITLQVLSACRCDRSQLHSPHPLHGAIWQVAKSQLFHVDLGTPRLRRLLVGFTTLCH